MREVLTIEVEIRGQEAVKGKTGEVQMILFGGYAECENFKGRILPGGVDTQAQWPGIPWTLSARYILEGVDGEGEPCRIFVENNGTVQEDGSLRTRPRILTDSRALAFLEEAELCGSVVGSEKGVTIHIFAG